MRDQNRHPAIPRSCFLGVCIATTVALHGEPTTRSATLTRDQVLAGMLTHDAQIRDLEVLYSLELGMNTPKPVSYGDTLWRMKGAKQYSSGVNVLTGNKWESAFDGKNSGRFVTHTTPPEGWICPGTPRGMQNSTTALHMSGRVVFEHSLVRALKAGNARVQSALEQIDGRRCVAIEGHMATKEIAGKDDLFFKIWLDPSCGFMPRRSEQYVYDKLGQLVAKHTLEKFDIAQASPGIWFPHSCEQMCVQIDKKKGRWELVTRNRWTAKKTIVNKGMDDALLELTFPPGTKVMQFTSERRKDYVEYVVVGPDLILIRDETVAAVKRQATQPSRENNHGSSATSQNSDEDIDTKNGVK